MLKYKKFPIGLILLVAMISTKLNGMYNNGQNFWNEQGNSYPASQGNKAKGQEKGKHKRKELLAIGASSSQGQAMLKNTFCGQRAGDGNN